MREYDLSGVLCGHLDKHLALIILEFLSNRPGLYDAAEIEASKLEIVEKTNMIDFAVDIYQQLNKTSEVRGPILPRGWPCRPARPVCPHRPFFLHRLIYRCSFDSSFRLCACFCTDIDPVRRLRVVCRSRKV
jgi:hypothetical protein